MAKSYSDLTFEEKLAASQLKEEFFASFGNDAEKVAAGVHQKIINNAMTK